MSIGMDFGVSIIILSYNTKDYTVNCVNSVFDNTLYPEYTVDVIDNASTDGSVEVLSKDKRINLTVNPQNIGLTRGWNQGIDIVKKREQFGDLLDRRVMLLNSDTLVKRGWLSTLSAIMDSNNNVGLCVYEDSRCPAVMGLDLPSNFSLFCFVSPLISGSLIEEMRAFDPLTEKICCFDPRFFVYWSDFVFCIRTVAMGWEIASSTENLVTHFHNRSTSLLANREEIFSKDKSMFWRVCSELGFPQKGEEK